MQVERMRQAVLEGLSMEEHSIFAKPPLPVMPPQYPHYPQDMGFRPAGASHPAVPPMGRGRGILGKGEALFLILHAFFPFIV